MDSAEKLIDFKNSIREIIKTDEKDECCMLLVLSDFIDDIDDKDIRVIEQALIDISKELKDDNERIYYLLSINSSKLRYNSGWFDSVLKEYAESKNNDLRSYALIIMEQNTDLLKGTNYV